VRFVEIPESQTLEALTAGRIDAAALANPGFYDAVHGTVARLLAPTYDEIAKSFLIGVYFTSEAYAQAHPDIVRKLSVALNAAGKWANANRAQSAKILEKYSGTPVPPGIPRVTYATALRVQDAQPVLDVLYAVGAIRKPIRAADLFAGNLSP
jgi:ABC-type nitrate/sulfonate/bicarbonate transport system substrate-binding protein